MKKIILFFTVLFTTVCSFGQDIRIGIKGGLNLANQKIKSGSFSSKGTTIASFHAGFVLDIPLTERLYAQPQLLLAGKGSKDFGFIFRPYYVELPVNIIYKYEINNGLKIYGGLGPGIGLGVFGNLKDLDNNFNRKLKFGETNNSDYKTVDFTGGFELGAEVNNKIGLGIGYRWSFADVTRGSNKVTHKVVNFSIAYFFGDTAAGKKKSNSSNKAGTRSRTKRD
jgi:Outer membrane protein beta-barrel domain